MRTQCALFGILVVSATLTATSAFSQESSEEKLNSFQSMPSPVPPSYLKTGEEVSTEIGRAVYIENCSVCHGLFGRGYGPRFSTRPDFQYIPDFSQTYMTDGRDDALMEAIREGLHRLEAPSITMPQFKYILSQPDIESVVEYLKILPEIAPPLLE